MWEICLLCPFSDSLGFLVGWFLLNPKYELLYSCKFSLLRIIWLIVDSIWLVVFQFIAVSLFLFLNYKTFSYILLPFQDIIWETMVVKSLMKWKSIDQTKSYMPLQQLFIMEIITKSKNVKLRWISSGEKPIW